jgi:hypothetical protein
MDGIIALFVTQVIDFSTYWPILGIAVGIGHWALGISYSSFDPLPPSFKGRYFKNQAVE